MTNPLPMQWVHEFHQGCGELAQKLESTIMVVAIHSVSHRVSVCSIGAPSASAELIEALADAPGFLCATARLLDSERDCERDPNIVRGPTH